MSNNNQKPVFVLQQPSAELREECAQRITLAKLFLVLEKPFFGILASKLTPVENNTWCKTLATDGRHLYYNVRYIMGMDASEKTAFRAEVKKAMPDVTDEQLAEVTEGLDKDELVFAVCHEILHCVYNHFIRRGNRDPQKFNRAADYAINQIIKREKIGKIKDTWLYDEKYENMAAEEIYLLLEKDDKGGASQDQHMQPGQEGGDEEGKQKRGTVKSIEEGDGADGSADGEMPDLDPSEMEKYMDDFQSTLMSASQQSDVPKEIADMINQFKEGKIDWREKLLRTLKSFLKNDASFMKPSRRSWNMGVIMPGLLPQDEIDICVAMDTSGSISHDMIRDFLSEIRGITQQYQQYKIRLLCFDTSVYNPQEFTESSIDDLDQYKIMGNGGTAFEVVWQYMKEEDYVPKQLIMFTDGYPCDSWGDPDYCETLFVLHGTTSIVAPFGDTTYYDEE